MGFPLARHAPGIQGVVHGHAVAQHFLVVGKLLRQAQRDRVQARRLRCQIEPGRVCAAHDQRQLLQDRVAQLVLLEQEVSDGPQACRSNVFWKGFASPPKTVVPETPAFRPGSAPTGLKAGVSNWSWF